MTERRHPTLPLQSRKLASSTTDPDIDIDLRRCLTRQRSLLVRPTPNTPSSVPKHHLHTKARHAPDKTLHGSGLCRPAELPNKRILPNRASLRPRYHVKKMFVLVETPWMWGVWANLRILLNRVRWSLQKHWRCAQPPFTGASAVRNARARLTRS